MATFTLEKLMIAVLAIVGFLILASVILGLNVGASLYYSGCEGKIGGELVDGKGYSNPRCSLLTNEISCELTTYGNVTIGEDSMFVCVWHETGANIGGKTTNCFMNEKLRCKYLSQDTTPRCSEVPDCRPVSSIKAAVERLRTT